MTGEQVAKYRMVQTIIRREGTPARAAKQHRH